MKLLTTSLATTCALVVVLNVAAPFAAAGDYENQTIIGKGALRGICYLAVDAKDNLVTLQRDGTVTTFDKAGKKVSSFASKISNAQTVAIDAKGVLYVLGVKMEVREMKRGAKTYKRIVPAGVIGEKFDVEGKSLGKLNLPGAKNTTGAACYKNYLLVADMTSRVVRSYHIKTGKSVGVLGKDVRTCCGIFDFGVNPNTGAVYLANLGAFKVSSFKLNGKPAGAFGSRGKTPETFHGCCNPVNVAVLSDGSIVTAEKSPSRIKLYNAKGVYQMTIPKVAELVSGCSKIPMACNSAGDVYVANTSKGHVVKCLKTGGVAGAAGTDEAVKACKCGRCATCIARNTVLRPNSKPCQQANRSASCSACHISR